MEENCVADVMNFHAERQSYQWVKRMNCEQPKQLASCRKFRHSLQKRFTYFNLVSSIPISNPPLSWVATTFVIVKEIDCTSSWIGLHWVGNASRLNICTMYCVSKYLGSCIAMYFNVLAELKYCKLKCETNVF